MKRIDFLLANSGAYTRSVARSLVLKGLVTANGRLILSPAEKVDEHAEICVDGEVLETEKYIYLMLNKPSGYISSTEGDDCVLSLVPKEFYRKGLFPVGRLDKDTEGLLLITNDGDFAHSVTSPTKKIEKTYYARLKNNVTESDISAFSMGMTTKNGERFLPALLVKTGENEAEITVVEGKYHEVKRLFLLCGNEVLYLKRLKIGGLFLDKSLKLGECRKISEDERSLILKSNNDG